LGHTSVQEGHLTIAGLGLKTSCVIIAAAQGRYVPLFDPSAMFVVAGMTAALSLFGVWITGLSITGWILAIGGLVGLADRSDRPTGPRMLLPLPFVLVSLGSFLMGLLDLIFRWPTIS
jgi:hypothetical protein